MNFSNTISISEHLSTLDWVLFFAILLITIASVFYGNSKAKKISKDSQSAVELLLMGRRLTLPLFVGTLVATWYGGIFGVTEIAFNQGVFNFVTQGFFWYLSYLLFAFFLVDRIDQYKAVTMPNLIEKMFGKKSAKLSAFFNFFNVLPIVYVTSIGILIDMIFNLGLSSSMAIGIFVVCLYSSFGGLSSVVYSDLIQFFIMCLGVFLVLLYSIGNFGGIGFLQESLPESHFSLTGNETIANTLIWGLIALSTLVDPNFYQRCFSASSKKVAKKGILISTVIWVCFDICTTLGAMYARAVIPEADSAGAYLTYSLQLLPPGLRGLFLAGILATILSTLDSYLFLASSTLSYDIFPRRFFNKKYFHFFCTILVGLFSYTLALIFDGNIKNIWKTLGSYSSACLLFPIIFGYIFPGKISDKAFVRSSLITALAVTIWRNVNRSGIFLQIDALYVGILTSFIIIILHIDLFGESSKKVC